LDWKGTERIGAAWLKSFHGEDRTGLDRRGMEGTGKEGTGKAWLKYYFSVT
jgi:hypothetical protein